MKLSKLILLAALSLTASVSQAAPNVSAPTNLGGCAFDDLSGVTVTQCAGFYDGNLIKAPYTTFVESLLEGTFGVSNTFTGAWIEKLDFLNGVQTINFVTPLTGMTIVALHFGGGNGGPATGESTAFYKLAAGTSLDSFQTKFGASSSAAVYVMSAIPESETYAMLLAGLGLMGAITRRRRQQQTWTA